MNLKNTPIAFAFENLAVCVIANGDNPLFVAKNVAIALGYERGSRNSTPFRPKVEIKKSA